MTHVGYPKLVRSRIPEICAAKDANETFRPVADWLERARLLDEKLDEELAEWRDGNDPLELADLLDVVWTTAVHRGIGWERLQELVEAKRAESGTLLDGPVWLGPAS